MGGQGTEKNRTDPKGVILCFFAMGKMGCVTKKAAPKTMIYVNIIREMEEKRWKAEMKKRSVQA